MPKRFAKLKTDDSLRKSGNKKAIYRTGFMCFMSVMTISSFSGNVLAQSNENKAEATNGSTVPKVVDEVDQKGKPFSIEGNGQLLDRSDDESKEFITISTKNNQTFFLVIDHAAATNNAYMLSMIDEDDLKDFVSEKNDTGLMLPEAEDKKEDVTDQSRAVKEESGDDIKDSDEKEYGDPSKALGNNSRTHMGSFLLIVICGLIITLLFGYYIKVYRPRKEAMEDEDEGLEDGFRISSDDGENEGNAGEDDYLSENTVQEEEYPEEDLNEDDDLQKEDI